MEYDRDWIDHRGANNIPNPHDGSGGAAIHVSINVL
jgi:hypothetical protein